MQYIQFYRLNIYPEDLLETIKDRDLIHKSIKILLSESQNNIEDIDNYIEKYFELIELDFLFLTKESIEEEMPNFSQDTKKVFDRRTHSLFMVDENLWEKIIKVVFKERDNSSNEFTKRDGSFVENKIKQLKTEMSYNSDLLELQSVFEKKTLFGAVL